MSEEMKEALQTNETAEAEKAEPEAAETMADYEEHFDDANPWNRVKEYMDNQTILPVKVEGVVNGGVIVMVEGLRGFVPASKLSLSYIEDLETYLLKDIEVRVIDVDQASNRLVLSAREVLKEKERKAREEQIANRAANHISLEASALQRLTGAKRLPRHLISGNAVHGLRNDDGRADHLFCGTRRPEKIFDALH